MNLFEIDQEIRNLVDPDTGELQDYEAFAALQMEKTRKIDNLMKFYKETVALANALVGEIQSLLERKQKLVKRAERLKQYLESVLGGEKYESAAGEVRYRRSESVEPDDGFIEWAKDNAPEFLKSEPKVDKTALKDAIKAGKNVEHAVLLVKTNMQIK